MTCPRCRRVNAPQARYCADCGARLVGACARCGTPVEPAGRFCSECGHPVDARAAPPARVGSPGAYTPPHLAEKILTGRMAVEGERKQVTVLFADVKASAELLPERDPEEVRRFLDPALAHMMDAVHRYEGTVNQVLPDGIMALFGVPLAHEDHAVRACYAGLRMLESVQRYAEDVRRHEGVPVLVRVGINSGEVVVRSIGSDLHMDYTAVGQTTHLAGRMQQMATPGSALITASTLALAEGYVQARSLGPMRVRGLETAVDVYELAGGGRARSRLQAAAARGLTPFVGREGELARLADALAQARAGRGQVVAIVGEPVVGKSRLVYELARSPHVSGWRVLESGSAAPGPSSAYSPVIELVRGYAHMEPADDARAAREKVTGAVLALDQGLASALPPLLALMGIPVEDAAWRQAEPQQRQQRTVEAVKRLLLRQSQAQPLLVIIEDLQGIDAETQALLDALVDSLAGARIGLVVDYRPEYRHRWSGKGCYQQLRLDTLAADSAEALLAALLGAAPDLPPLKRLLIERTGGNPLFLEESVRSVADAGALAGTRGGYRLARPLAGIQVPPTVHAILAARIDRLEPAEKRLLQSAAVIGKEVPLPMLQALADVPEGREGFVPLSLLIAGDLGQALAVTGRVAEAVALLEGAGAQSASVRIMTTHAFTETWLAQAYGLAGRHEEAERAARWSLDRTRTHHQRWLEGGALRVLGDILSARPRPDLEEAEACYRGAVEIATALEMRPWERLSRLALGRLLRRRGDRPGAEEHLRAAAEGFRGLGMSFWLEAVEAELRAPGVASPSPP